jgi:hypothetical protein
MASVAGVSSEIRFILVFDPGTWKARALVEICKIGDDVWGALT